MVLSDGEIWEALANREMQIALPDGYHPLVKSASLDMRLDPEIQVIRPHLISQSEIIDPTTIPDVPAKIAQHAEARRLFSDQPFVMNRGDFVIGKTAEEVTLSSALAGWIEGKSSLARFGVIVHLTAPKIDPGYSNKITLEIMNLGRFRISLSPMMEIAALIVERLGRPAIRRYQGRFSGP